MIPLPSTLTLEQAKERLRFANSYSRLPSLIELAWQMEWGDWLALLGEEWPSCDNIGLHLDELLEQTPLADVVEQPKALRHWLMTADELAALNALPETVTLWRGCYQPNKWGLSWSLDRAKAASFPFLHRYQQEGQALLVKARIPALRQPSMTVTRSLMMRNRDWMGRAIGTGLISRLCLCKPLQNSTSHLGTVNLIRLVDLSGRRHKSPQAGPR